MQSVDEALRGLWNLGAQPPSDQLTQLETFLAAGKPGAVLAPWVVQLLRDPRCSRRERRDVLVLLQKMDTDLTPLLSELVEVYAGVEHLTSQDRTRLRRILDSRVEPVIGKAVQLYLDKGAPHALELLLLSDSKEALGLARVLDESARTAGTPVSFFADVRDVFMRTGAGGTVLERAVEAREPGISPRETIEMVGKALERKVLKSPHGSWRKSPSQTVCRYASWLRMVHVRNVGTDLGSLAYSLVEQWMSAEWLVDCPIPVDADTALRAFACLEAADKDERKEILKCLALTKSPWATIAYEALHSDEYSHESLLIECRAMVEEGPTGIPMVLATMCGGLVSDEEVADDAALLRTLTKATDTRVLDVHKVVESAFPRRCLESAHRHYVRLLEAMLHQAHTEMITASEATHSAEQRSDDAHRRFLVDSLSDYQSLRRQLGLPSDEKAEQWITRYKTGA